MTNEEIAVTLAEHNKEIGSLKHRVDELEALTKSINELALNVKELATTVSVSNAKMNSYDDRLRYQGERIGALEKQPANKYNTISTALVTAIISAVVTFVFATL